MRLFDKRPLCLACTAALLLSAVFTYAGLYAVFAAAASAAVFAVVFCILKTRAKRTVLVVCAAVLVMSAAFCAYLYGAGSVTTGKTVRVSGYAVPGSDNGYTQIFRITEADGKPVNIKAVSYIDETCCEDFSVFEGEASISLYKGYNEYYYKSKGALYSVTFSGFALTGKTHKNVSYYACMIRDLAASCLYRVCDNAGVLCRLFLGVREGVSQSFLSDMKTLGVSHLLAVSGLHVTALLAGADFVMTKIAGKSRVKYVILACAALLYMAVTGFTGSVVRASVMYLLSRISLITGRKNDPVTSLTLSAFIIVAVNPPSVFDVGFLLSFSAALGIIVAGAPASEFVAKRLPQKIRFLKNVTSPVIITAFVLIFTLPVAALSYGKLAYGAILYNLIISPFAVVLLYVCPYIVLFSYVPFLGRGLGLMADGLCTVLIKLTHALAQHAAPSVSISYPFVIPLIAVFVAATAVLAVFSKKRLHYLCLALAFVLCFSSFAAIFSLTEAQKTAIIVSPGKYGDCAAVLEHGKCTVFDFTSGDSDGFYQLFEKLLSLGITRADYVLAAKPDSRHLQSVIRICSYFDIDKIYAPSEIANDLSAFCDREVIKTDGLAQKYKNASLISDDKTLLLSVGDAVYINGFKGKNADAASGFKTVIISGGEDADSALPSGNIYYTNECEKVLVIYIND